jgi:predicted Zn-ribbon and HTH transcriptional regulator
MKKAKIEDIKIEFERNGYLLLSDVYINCKKNLLIQHIKCGYKYEKTLDKFRSGNRCPKCSRAVISEKQRLDKDTIVQNFKNFGFEVISDISLYVNTKTKIVLRHKCGYEFSRTVDSFNNYKKCPKCEGLEIYNIKTIKENLAKNGYKLLEKYKGAIARKHLLEHNCGSIEVKGIENVLKRNKCNNCHGRVQNIEKIKKYIEKYEFVQLSSYKNNQSPILMKCKSGHIQERSWNVFSKKPLICSYCKINFNENKCRKILENLLKTEFPRKRSIFQENKSLELDGYNENLKLAFEYNGIQHYKNIKFFHKKGDDLEIRKKRDLIKQELCNLYKIKLIIIPYYIENKEDFIKSKLIEFDINL